MTSLLLRAARLVPIGPVGPAAVPDRPVDVLVEDGVVTAVGAELDRPAGADELDAEGRWLVPGLWDQHTHLTQWTLVSQRLDLAPARTPEQALAMVADRAAAQPGVPLVGWGHRTGLWER